MSEYLDDFFRSMHEAEWDRKDKHDSADAFLLGVVTLLGGVGHHYLSIFPPEITNLSCVLFVAFTILFAVAWAAAVVCVAGSVIPRDYGYLADSRQLDDYSNKLADYYNFDNERDEARQKTEREFRQEARKQYVQCAGVNRASNQAKLKWQSRAKYVSIIAVTLFLFNILPTYFVQCSQETSKRIESTAPEAGMSKDPKSSGTSSQSQSKQAPPKPVPPPPQIFREDKNPPTKRGTK